MRLNPSEVHKNVRQIATIFAPSAVSRSDAVLMTCQTLQILRESRVMNLTIMGRPNARLCELRARRIIRSKAALLEEHFHLTRLEDVLIVNVTVSEWTLLGLGRGFEGEGHARESSKANR